VEIPCIECDISNTVHLLVKTSSTRGNHAPKIRGCSERSSPEDPHLLLPYLTPGSAILHRPLSPPSGELKHHISINLQSRSNWTSSESRFVFPIRHPAAELIHYQNGRLLQGPRSSHSSVQALTRLKSRYRTPPFSTLHLMY
jgi:hypothetical protein